METIFADVKFIPQENGESLEEREALVRNLIEQLKAEAASQGRTEITIKKVEIGTFDVLLAY